MSFHEIWVSNGYPLLHTTACYVLRLLAVRYAARNNTRYYIIKDPSVNSLRPSDAYMRQ